MLSRRPILDFVCPVCAAQPREECELRTGAPRFEPHVERKWIAGDHNPEQPLDRPRLAKKPPQHQGAKAPDSPNSAKLRFLPVEAGKPRRNVSCGNLHPDR